MACWSKEEIEIGDGTKVSAQMPIIVSASRSTDVPAFYADWFMERLKAGYIKWFNPFNGVPLYVGFKKMRCIVFWSKNPAPMIERLSGKYQHPVSERGATFSQGERQLLSFARTLAYDPAILILDEATASIDTHTEQLIQEAIARLMQGRTCIMVAHRLSTIQNADCIMVMHHGRIRERGTHQQLLSLNGIYAKLYALQIASH